ncbi:MAG TPA: amidohydrolase family protein [Alphaproteobacteria bacterium]|nr:amidohydrolase family protein [Alphaproteobacteria bacterium]
MAFDLLIRNGVVVDGSGLARYQADVGITDGRIAAIGRLSEPAKETIDAGGHAVAPGFIDAHTHMDAQVFWDPLGTCSCWHGVTTAIMGNCGFSVAPCAEKDKHLVLKNLERAEDISPKAMEAGIRWAWEDFGQYLDAVDKVPKGINYAAYVGHSALRTYVMRERAFEQEATDDDLKRMKDVLAASMRAGAMGFSTSRTGNHLTADGKPVASRLANWNEVCELVGVLRDGGIFELSREDIKEDPVHRRDYFERLKRLAVETRVPTTYSGNYSRKMKNVGAWRDFYDLADAITAEGGRALVQAHSRWAATLLSFESSMPYDSAPLWREFRARPLAEQEAALRDPEMRSKLVAAAEENAKKPSGAVGTEVNSNVDYEWLFPVERLTPPYRSVGKIARERSQSPIDVVIDLALEKRLRMFFLTPVFNENQDVVEQMMKHPRAAVTFSDSGAHVSQIMDSSLQTHMLAYWVRERGAFTLEQAVRKMTFDIAAFWNLKGRGLLREGNVADIVIFDPERVAARMPTVEHDLPGGARRLKQTADGILATVVGGAVVLRDNDHTGALPGKLLRGAAARA